MKNLILKESDNCSLTIRVSELPNKPKIINFQTSTLYYGEENNRVAAIWLNKAQAKKLVKKLEEFINI